MAIKNHTKSQKPAVTETIEKPSKFNVVGVGNPLLDILSPINQAFLDKHGLKMSNAILIEKDRTLIHEEMKSHPQVQYLAGGSTLNSIRICQWVLRREMPNCSAYVGCIGNDANGEILRKCANENGVETFFMVDPAEPTGVCGVGILDKERTLVTHLAAANKFHSSHLQNSEIRRVFEEAGFVYISGFFLTVSIDSILSIGKDASLKRKTLALNISAEFIVQAFAENLQKALFHADIVFMNEHEAVAYAKFVLKKKTITLQEIARSISVLPKSNDSERVTVITRGQNSTLVDVGGKSLINVSVAPLDQELVVDLNGAGDAFVGGFIAGRIRGADLRDCAVLGHKAARKIICASGVSFEGDFE